MSGTFNSNVVANTFYGRIDWSYTQNVNAGTTTVKATMYLATQANQMRSFRMYNTLTAINIGGNVKSSGWVYNGINYNPNQYSAHVQQVYTHTATITHNANGGPTSVKIVGEIAVDQAAVNAGIAPSRINFSKDVSIPAIHRKATMVQPAAGQVGKATTFTFSRPNTNTEVFLQWRTPGGEWNRIQQWGKVNSLTYTWPESAVPNRARSLSDTVQLSFSSRIGDTNLGWDSFTTTVSIAPTAPSVSVTRVEDRSAYKLVLNHAAFIANVSTLKLTASGTAHQGATISQYIVEHNGVQSAHTSNVIDLPAPNESGNRTIKVKVRDSRGNESGWVSHTITVLPYNPPTLGRSTAYRTGSGDIQIGVRLEQRVSPVAWNGSNRNQYTIRARIRRNSGSFGSYVNLYTNKKDMWDIPLAIAIPNTTVPQADSAEVELSIQDNFSQVVTMIVPLAGAPVVLSYNRVGVGVGMVRPTSGKTLEVGGSGTNSPAYYIAGKKLDFSVENSGRINVATHQGLSSPKYFIGNDELRLWTKPSGYVNTIADNSNLDNHRTPGVFMANNVAVGPKVSGTNQFYVFNVMESDAYGAQIAIQKNSGKLYSRSRHNNVWQSWVEHGGTASIQEVVNNTLTKNWETNSRIQMKRFGDMLAVRCTYTHTSATATVVLGTVPSAFHPAAARALQLIPNTAAEHTRLLQLNPDGTLRLFNCVQNKSYHIDIIITR